MLPGSSSSIRLFALFGITVYLHWSWFLVAVWQIDRSADDSLFLGAATYLGLFLLVLMHEFGHSLACRQVGGVAREIVLWPLGGVAYVAPPQRPGPVLWSIAAGPLVNAVLVPVFYIALRLMEGSGLVYTAPQWVYLVEVLGKINLVLLIFNILPIYPLDGGQILQALLWFKMSRGRSTAVASIIGLVLASLLTAWALWSRDILKIAIGAFIINRAWAGLQQARAMTRIEQWPRHNGYRCPGCNTHPPEAELWQCSQCQHVYDLFEHNGHCPSCHTPSPIAVCPECREAFPFQNWRGGRPPVIQGETVP